MIDEQYACGGHLLQSLGHDFVSLAPCDAVDYQVENQFQILLPSGQSHHPVSVVCCSHSQSTQYQVNVIDSGDSHI